MAAELQSSVCIGKTGFAKMQGDFDKHRSAKQQSADILTSEVTRKTKFVDFFIIDFLNIFYLFFSELKRCFMFCCYKKLKFESNFDTFYYVFIINYLHAN